MTQRLLLPVYRIDVDFVVRHGRSWSSLEHLVLWACMEPSSAECLSRRSAVPLRLVSECLVNLLRVGWIELRELSSGTVFAATAIGVVQAAKPIPDRDVEAQPRSGQVYMERLTGAFFATRELKVIRSDDSGFCTEDALPPRFYRSAPFGPEIAGLLPMRRDDTFERLRKVRLLPGEFHAVLEAGPTGIAGLPPRTSASLGLAVLEALRQACSAGKPASALRVEGALGAPLADRKLSKRIVFGPDTLVVGGPAHLEAAEQLVRRAKTLVVVHSTFVGANIDKLLPALSDAAVAGVQVHVHWGRSDDPEGLVSNPAEMAARLARTRIPDEHRGNFHIGSRSTGSHAKVMLADTGNSSGYCAIVGSCNWLDSPFRSVEASVRLTDAVAVGDVAARLAAMLVPAIGEEPVVSHLLQVHGDCAAKPQPPSPHSAMLVADEDHYAAVRDAMREVPRGGSVLLGSHKLGHAGVPAVVDPMREAARHGALVKLYYTRVLPNFGDAAAKAMGTELARESIEMGEAARQMHAKFLGWNERLLVSSFNFLSGNATPRNRSGTELGVLLAGPGVLDAFEAALRAAGVASAPAEPGRVRKRRRRPRRKAPSVN